MKICVVTPVYNEGQKAVEVVKKIRKFTSSHIIVVDDGSEDNSFILLNRIFAKNKQVDVIRHMVNLGKGAAMNTGVMMAWKIGAEAVIFIDSDGQHDPKFLPEFEAALRKNQLVFGYRDFGGQMPYVRKLGNIIAVLIVRNLFNVKRKDLLCGFFGFRKKIYKDVFWESSRYGVETEIATRVGKNKLDFSEIKIDTIYLDEYKGVSFFDALRILSYIPIWYIRK